MANKDTNSAVIRVHKDKNYTVMSNEHLLFTKPPMSLKAKGLLSMFLALPDDWNYSISGLSSICKESRDCIRSTMDELKTHGYLDVEKINGENGRFTYIYHIFERSQKRLPDTENPHLEDPIPEHPIPANPIQEDPIPEHPTQLNINEINTNEQNTNNKDFISSAEELLNIYKSICIDFSQPRCLTDTRKTKANSRLSEINDKNFWITVCKKAQESSFIKKNHFFSFDWIIQNDTNASKVFEGKYDDKNQTQCVTPGSAGKYSGYHSKQEEM